MDDGRVGLAIRALRRRRGWRQRDLAAAAAVSQATISILERGHLDRASVRVVRDVVEALDGRATFDIRWRGAALDRLLDERHAALGARVVAELRAHAWEAQVEVSYARYAERGSIDVLGWHPETRSLLVVELKTEIASAEETLRKHDEKVRLAPQIARERCGWRPTVVGRVLVLPDDRTVRRRWAKMESLMSAAMPAATVEVKRWIRAPRRELFGVWFLPLIDVSSRSRSSASRERVRCPRSGSSQAPPSSAERPLRRESASPRSVGASPAD
jgi:transcriptional regulator with XRE-family HTH domain